MPATHPRARRGRDRRRASSPRCATATSCVHHPYDSFATSVQRFIEQAAADPHVLAIKQTLYRTSRRLADRRRADRRGRGRQAGGGAGRDQGPLRRAGQHRAGRASWSAPACHVVYGLVGLKTHCKTALVVRQEGNGIRRYCHIGTGNYNPKTARLYEDLGLLTADPEIGADLTDLFNVLTGYSPADRVPERCWSRRTASAAGSIERIERRDRAHRAGQAGPDPAQGELARRRADDRRALPGVAGRRAGRPAGPRHLRAAARGAGAVSENIRVRSILGRFLEHSRIFHFGNGGEPEYWIGSADLMHRNLDRRVEALVRVADERLAATWARCSTRASTRPPAAGRSRPTARGGPRRHRLGVSPVRDHQAEMMRLHSAAPRSTGSRRSATASARGAVIAADASAASGRRRRSGAAPCAAAGDAGGRDRARAPAPLRRLVAAQGQARARRVDGRRRRPGGPGGDRGRARGSAPWLRDVATRCADGRKLVRYWSTQAAHSAATSRRTTRSTSCAGSPPNRGATLLSYAHDRGRAGPASMELGPPTPVLLLVRHAKAGERDDWDGPDQLRPLAGAGAQAGAGAAPSCCRCSARTASAPRRRCAAARRSPRWPTRWACRSRTSRCSARRATTTTRTPRCSGCASWRAQPGVTVVCSQGGVIPDAGRDCWPATARAAGGRATPHDVPSNEGQRLGAGGLRRRPGAGLRRLLTRRLRPSQRSPLARIAAGGYCGHSCAACLLVRLVTLAVGALRRAFLAGGPSPSRPSSRPAAASLRGGWSSCAFAGLVVLPGGRRRRSRRRGAAAASACEPAPWSAWPRPVAAVRPRRSSQPPADGARWPASDLGRRGGLGCAARPRRCGSRCPGAERGHGRRAEPSTASPVRGLRPRAGGPGPALEHAEPGERHRVA